MFERFTEKAIKVIMLAQEESRRLGHNYVGSGQLLLGLIGEGTGIAAKSLKSMGINLKDSRVEVQKIIGRGSGFVAVEIPFTPRARQIIDFAWDEARELAHNYIGTEHLLLGLIREMDYIQFPTPKDPGVASKVLTNLGVSHEKLRQHILRLAFPDAEGNERYTTEQRGGSGMFEKFTAGAIKVIMLAQEEARRLGHNFVGSEQILLGIIGENCSGAAAVLLDKGVNLKDAREEVERIIHRGSGFVSVEIPFTPRSKRILELSWRAAQDLKHKFIGAEHLLLGIIEEKKGVAIRVLDALNVDPLEVREILLARVDEWARKSVSGEGEPLWPRQIAERTCPNCAEQIKPKAIMCRHCYAGISQEHYQPCPFCAEMVRKRAKLCRYCQSTLTADQ